MFVNELKEVFEALKNLATKQSTINFILSMITGIISGLLVSIVWQKHMNKIEEDIRDENSKTEYVKQFRDDIQTLWHYLERVRVELALPDNGDKPSNILRIIALRPMTYSFSDGMTDDGLSIIHEIEACLNELKADAKNNSINYYNYNTRIFKDGMELLESQHKIIKPWVKPPKKVATQKGTTKKSTAEKGTTKKSATKKGAADMDAK